MPTAPVNGTASLGEDGVLHIDIHGPLSGDRVFFEVGDAISVTGAGGTIEGVVTPASVLATHDPLFVDCTVALSGSVHTFTRIE
jgi:hypothetical protein